jgi:2-oxoisovalerate dehydrogenase E1 component
MNPQTRVEIVEGNLDHYLETATPAPVPLAPHAPLRPGSALTARRALELFEDQALSRALDVAARELKKTNRSFYTISSAGHENNVVVGSLLRTTDPAFLHYRSGAFMMARARQAPGATPVFDTLLSSRPTSPRRSAPRSRSGAPGASGWPASCPPTRSSAAVPAMRP